jgi:AcrR family transcriptional regulator
VSKAPAPARLPRGPHKLTRDEVSLAQRTRLIRAMAEVMAEKGYVETTVADVLRRAGIGRETFYQQFSSKQDCFIAAYDAATEVILSGAARDAHAPGTPLARFDRAIGHYLHALAAEPAFARLFMVEVYAAGEETLKRRNEIQDQFVDLVLSAFGARDETTRFTCEALVASIITLVTTRLSERDVDGLLALREPLTRLVRQALEHA